MVKAIGLYTITVVNDGVDGQPGTNGANAIQMLLSNENHTLPANENGVVLSYDGASTTVSVYEGSLNVTSEYTIARTASTGITTTLSGNVVTVTNVTSGTRTGTVTITATKGTVTLTKIFTISVSRAGTNGSSVTITSQVVEYKEGTSDHVPPTGTWSTTMPTPLTKGYYLWTRTTVNYSGGTSTVSYSVSYTANDGTAGRGISNTAVAYAKSSSGTQTPSSGSFGPNIPSDMAPGDYLWTRTTLTYDKGTPTTSVSYSVSKWGEQGPQGQAGADAKVVNVSPSKQVFKSTTGATGQFTPQYIYLYPTFQGVTYSKWQYSTNGTSWTNVTSGSNSLTIGTYNSVPNSLRIERTCNLFTDAVTAISFKCLSSDNSAYDTVTVTKIYDVTDLEIGGRNYFKKVSTNETYARGTFNDDYEYTLNDYQNTGSFTQFGNLSVPMSTFLGRDVIMSFDIKSPNGNATLNNIYNSNGNPRYLISSVSMSDNALTTEWKHIVAKFTVTDAGSDKSETASNKIEVYVPSKMGCIIRKVKVELGNITTDWTKAPEDDMQIIASPTTPLTPEVGVAWLNTETGDISYWDGTQWVVRDLSQYVTDADISTQVNSKSKVWVPLPGETPTHPYYAGDLWVVNDPNSENNGKILTCIANSRGSYNLSDWFVPLTAYTTVTDMTNVIGTSPSEWGTTSKSITTLINEANNTIASVSSQTADLAVRASEIEMSFSITGTMNFLGNSSGQNSLQLWSISPTGISPIQTASAVGASDVRQQLVSGSSFYFNQTWGSGHAVTFTSNPIIPPTGNDYTVSLKIRNQSNHSIVRLNVYSYSDAAGTVEIPNSLVTLNIPYASDARSQFNIEHVVVHKVDGVARIKVAISFLQPQVTSISKLPTYNANYMGMLYRVGTQGYWGASEYAKIEVIDPVEPPTNMSLYNVWKCPMNIGTTYISGIYYEKNSSGNLVPINDSYAITMLDKDNYYKRIPTAWETVTVGNAGTYLVPGNSPIYFGDIMVNGGTMVQTWTPRQDENLWGDNIKFSSAGISIENKGNMTKRMMDESSDLSFIMNEDGSIKKILWKLTGTGFIVEDILCKGEFSMGYVPSQYDGDNEHIVDNFRAVTTLKRSTANDGVDEYIYVNS